MTECWSTAEVIEASRNRSGRWRAAKNRPKIRLANQFEALAEVEEVTEDDGEMDLNCPVKLEDHGNIDCTLGHNDTMDFYAEAGEGAVAQDIQAVLEEGVVGRGEIVIDSGAAESVCPWDWADAFPTKTVPPGQELLFRNASGGRMAHYGENA